ncbi:MAG: penicillin-binding transpeptidase domain-containing protein, partial [Candidatus Saccharimonadales bacterium]
PEGQLAAQTLGFVDSEGNGQYGIEGALNQRLSGTDGLLQSVTDVRDVPLTIGDKNINIPAKNGDNVVMTIDRNVQSYTEQALADGLKRSGATHGSVVVMDPQSGKVMAMANLPTFKPAEFNKVTNAAVFNNGTISEPYEAGSVVKMFTLATGIDKGVVEPTDTYINTDSIRVENKIISNATKGQTGRITFQHAMNYSLNTGFVTIAQRLGDGSYITHKARSTMYNYFYTKFGLAQPTGIELSGEAAGIIRTPDIAGAAVQYSNMAFGQGMNVTMLQVAAAFSSVINGGTYYHPTIVTGNIDADSGQLVVATPKPPKLGVIAGSTSDKVRKVAHDARNAFYGGSDRKGFYVGGKTGTSETLQDSGYVDNVTVSSYLGYGGDSSGRGGPKYVIMVRVSGKNLNLGGNTDAMPIFTDISNWMLDYMKLHPKGQ